MKRLFIGNAVTVNIDSKHRMELSEEILSMFRNEHSLYFVGVGDYIEIWTKDMLDSWKGSQMPKDVPSEEL